MTPKARTYTAIAALTLAGGALSLAPGKLPGMNAEAAAPTADAIAPAIRTVLVDVVRFEKADSVQGLPGTIAPFAVSRLSFRVDGKVTERLVDIGDRVREGDPIARLDDTDLGGVLDSKDGFGRSVAALGDTNGDGTPDLAVGAVGDAKGFALRARRKLTKGSEAWQRANDILVTGGDGKPGEETPMPRDPKRKRKPGFSFDWRAETQPRSFGGR